MNVICNLSSFPTQTFLLLCSHLYSLASIHTLTKITEWSPYLSLWWANPPTYPVHKWQNVISKILVVNNFFYSKPFKGSTLILLILVYCVPQDLSPAYLSNVIYCYSPSSPLFCSHPGFLFIPGTHEAHSCYMASHRLFSLPVTL